jgi:hypothetical protein
MVEAVLGNAWNNIIIIFIFSILIDIDHLPYLLKVGGGVVKKRFGSEARTRFHEVYGLTLFSVAACVLYFFVNGQILAIALTCVLLHLAVDFLTGKSMPFYPYSKKEIFLGVTPTGYTAKIFFEVSSTMILGVLFWLQTGNLIL